MIQGISNWFLKIYKSRSNLDYDDEIFIYGIEVMITSLLNIFLLLFIGIISGTVNQAIVYFGSYAFLRKFIGGYHCNTNFKLSLINLFLCSKGALNIISTNVIVIINIIIISLIIICG